MPIVAQCSQCGQRYQVPDQMAGKQAKCQKCGAAVPIPVPGSASAGPPQPAAPSQPFGMQPGFGMPGMDPTAMGQGGWAQPGMGMPGDPAMGQAPFGQPAYGAQSFGQPGMFPQAGLGQPGFPPAPGSPYASPQAGYGASPRKSSPTKAAGIGLMVAGALCIVAHLVHIIAATLLTPEPPQPPPGMTAEAAQGYAMGAKAGKYAVVGCFLAVGLPIDIIILVGGLKLMNRKGRSMAMTGSILAMLPCSLAWPISLGLGIWAMVVLSQNKGAFR